MKILKLLDELKPNTQLSGEDIVSDMYYKYRITDLNKPIVISFPPANAKANTSDPKISPYSFDFICKFDVNVISFGIFGAHALNYFITPEFSRFIEKLGMLLTKFKIRLGLANSKGGFGIGTYAEALKLDQVMLFFPESAKQKELVPWDFRGSKELQNLKWKAPYNDVNLGACKGYIIYDPLLEVDASHAKRFKGLTHIKINGLSHGDGYRFLSKTSDIINDLVRDFFYNQEIDMRNLRFKTKVLRLYRTYYVHLLKKKPDNKVLLKNREKLREILIMNRPKR